MRLALAAMFLVAGSALAQPVTGAVLLKGAPPSVAPLKVTRDESACGANVPDDSLQVGPDRGIANAVVVVRTAAPSEAPAPQTATIEQRGCRFLPRVVALTVGSTLELTNEDPVLHNSRANAGAKMLFNFPFPMRNLKRKVKLDKPNVVDIRCDAGHTWMRSIVHVVEHRWFALTDAHGKFSIDDVPKDATELEIRHERLKEPLVVPLAAKRSEVKIELPAEALAPAL
jgi:hypothetical protein